MEDKLRLVCDEIIDRVCEEGRATSSRDIAAPLPLIVIGDMLGVAPEDRDDLLRWSDDMLRAQGAPDPALDGAAMHAFVEYSDYIHPVFDDRRGHARTPTTWSACCATPRSTATRSTTTRWCTRRCSS